MAQGNERLKVIATVLLLAAAAILAYWFYSSGGQQENARLEAGSAINLQTFSEILLKAQSAYIIMDVRDVADSTVRRNILQCGADFAGSEGLVGKNLTFYSLDNGEKCFGARGNYTAGECLCQAKGGVTIYVQEGSAPAYYTNAMVVGIGSNYSAGGCSIRIRQ